MKRECGVLFLILLVLLTGCRAVYTNPVQEALDDAGVEAHSPPGFEVRGYVTTDGVRHSERGYMYVLPSGDLRFRSFASLGQPDLVEAVTLPRENVQALLVEEYEVVSTTLLVILVIPLVLVLLFNNSDDCDCIGHCPCDD